MSPAHCFERAPAPAVPRIVARRLAQCPRGASRAPTGRLGRQLTDTLAWRRRLLSPSRIILRKGRLMVRFRCNLDRGRLCSERFSRIEDARA
jgi:hypothetical protein